MHFIFTFLFRRLKHTLDFSLLFLIIPSFPCHRMSMMMMWTWLQCVAYLWRQRRRRQQRDERFILSRPAHCILSTTAYNKNKYTTIRLNNSIQNYQSKGVSHRIRHRYFHFVKNARQMVHDCKSILSISHIIRVIFDNKYWCFQSEYIPDGLYLIEAVHSNKFITFTPERSTLVQQEQNLDVNSWLNGEKQQDHN